MATTLSKLLSRGGHVLKKLRQQAAGWFRRTIRDVLRAEDPTNPQGDIQAVSRTFMEGTMIAYAYDPKWKHKLPYYDKYPLVIPLRVASDRFVGLNLHYVDPQTRLAFIRELQQMASATNPVVRDRHGGSIYNAAVAYGIYRPCIHQYLYSHVRSQFRHIPPEEWEHAVLLPWAQFVGASERDVWAGIGAYRQRRREERRRRREQR